jgi:hypothetical protein
MNALRRKTGVFIVSLFSCVFHQSFRNVREYSRKIFIEPPIGQCVQQHLHELIPQTFNNVEGPVVA